MSEASDNLSEDEYFVERIVDHRKHAGKLQYLIKWKFYTEDDNTWESESNVYALDLIQAYWADRGGADALEEARKSTNRKASTKKGKGRQEPSKRALPESSSTHNESPKRPRVKDATTVTQDAVVESSPSVQGPITDIENTTVARETSPRKQSPAADDMVLDETIVENTATTTVTHIFNEELPPIDDLHFDEETSLEPSPENTSSPVREELDALETSPKLVYEESSVEPSPEPPVASQASTPDEARVSEEPPALDMSPILEQSPVPGEPPLVKIPPVDEEADSPPTDKPTSATEEDIADGDSPDNSFIESTQPIAVADAADAGSIQPTNNVQEDNPMVDTASDKADDGTDMVSEPASSVDEAQLLDSMDDGASNTQEATVINEQEVQRAMYGSVTSLFKSREKNIKPISDINTDDVIYDENFPADPSDWEKVKEVIAVTQIPRDTPDSETFVVVRWDNDLLSMHPSNQVRTHCAHQLINFYEKSLKFVV